MAELSLSNIQEIDAKQDSDTKDIEGVLVLHTPEEK